MISAATLANLRRKSAYIDQVQMHEGVPLWSWIDLNLTELCNRKCVFCPRVDDDAYPNQKLHASPSLIRKIADELHALDYQGAVVMCGFGEPMLHPKLEELASYFTGIRLELVTNGDFLSVPKIGRLVEAGVDYFVVSLYDGPHQVEPMRRMFEQAGCDSDRFMLRDRWHSEEDSFGLKLTNRAGMVHVGPQDPVDTTLPCHYLAYSMVVDWNGDVLLCVQDWSKKVKFGNLYSQSLLEIWTSRAMHKRRMKLIDGKRTDAPCSGCNTDGCLHGYNHVPVWLGS